MSIQDLIVKKSELGESAMEKILKPYVKFVDNGELSFNPTFFDLTAEERIGIALIAKESWRYIPGKEGLSGGMKNDELERATLLTGNTVRPQIKRLRDKGFVRTEKSVHYSTTKLVMILQEKVGPAK